MAEPDHQDQVTSISKEEENEEPNEIYFHPELSGFSNIPESLSEMFSFAQPESLDISTLHRPWQWHVTADETPYQSPSAYELRVPQPTRHDLLNSQPIASRTRHPQPTNHQPWYQDPTSHGIQKNKHQPWDLRSMVHRARERQPKAHVPWNLQRKTFKSQKPTPRIIVSQELTRRTHRSLQPHLGSLDSSSRERGPLNLPLTVLGSCKSQSRYKKPVSQPRMDISLNSSNRVHGPSDLQQRAYESVDLPHREQESCILQYQCLTANLNLEENQIKSTSETRQRSNDSGEYINLVMQQRNYASHPHNQDLFFQAVQGIAPVQIEVLESNIDVVSTPRRAATPYTEHSNGRAYNTPRVELSSIGPSEYAAATTLQFLKNSQESCGTPAKISELPLEQPQRTRVKNSPHENCYEIPMTLCSNLFDPQPEEISRDPIPPPPSALQQTRYPISNTGMYLTHSASDRQAYSPMYSPAHFPALSSTFSLPLSYSSSHYANTSNSMTPANSYQDSYISFANSISDNVPAFPDTRTSRYRYSTLFYPLMGSSTYTPPLLFSFVNSSSSMTTPNILTASSQNENRNSSRARDTRKDS